MEEEELAKEQSERDEKYEEQLKSRTRGQTGERRQRGRRPMGKPKDTVLPHKAALAA